MAFDVPFAAAGEIVEIRDRFFHPAVEQVVGEMTADKPGAANDDVLPVPLFASVNGRIPTSFQPP